MELRAGVADAAEDLPHPEERGVKERLAARHEGAADLALGVGPRDDVGEAEVAEGVARVGAVEAQVVAAEREADAVVQRKAQGEIELEIALLAGRAPDGAGVE